MLRRVLFAAFLCLSVWAVADRPVIAASPVPAGIAFWTTDLPCDADNAPDHWDAGQRYRIASTETSWRSHLQPVAFAGVSPAEDGRALLHRQALARSAPDRSPHLHHTPLLI